MKLLKSLNHHLMINIAVTIIVMATGHLVFYVLGQL